MATIAESQALNAVPNIAKSLSEISRSMQVIAGALGDLNALLMAIHPEAAEEFLDGDAPER